MLSRPLSPLSPTEAESMLVEEMSLALIAANVPIEDEAAVLRALVAARFRSGDVVMLSDRAVERARAHRQAPTSINAVVGGVSNQTHTSYRGA